MLSEQPWHKAVLTTLHNKRFVDECVYQTLLLNDPSLTICGTNLRYIKWETTTSANPKWLDMSDTAELIKSTGHFARKIRPHAQLLDWLDAKLEIEESTT